jgi:CubicO group peptidase (beta-lactamase class C family)
MIGPRLFLAASVLALAAFAQQPSPSSVDALFSDFAKPGSPGCALGVYRDGKIVYAKGYGLANVEQQTPITPASVFDIGSTSKQFTAASILLLKQEGKLRLDDDIHKYLQELPEYAGPDGGKVTILQLLNHTSGMRDYLTLFTMAGIPIDSVTTDDTALAILSRQKALNFAPGSDFLYSNSGYFLLSIIVKRAGGMNLRDYARKNIFDPLEMTHTQYRNDHRALIPNRALAYSASGGGYRLNVSYFEQLGDGGVHTTVEDLLKWDENFYTPRVGGKEMLAEILEPGKLANSKTLEYAKGLGHRTYKGLAVVEHAGSWGGYRAELLRFPEQHFSVACLCNLASANPSRFAIQTAELFLKDQMKSENPAATPAARPPASTPAPPDPASLASYAGDYASEELGVIYRLSVIDGKLSLAAILDAGGFPRNAVPAELRPTVKGQFSVGGLNIAFDRATDGAVRSFRADAGRTKGIVFKRR